MTFDLQAPAAAHIWPIIVLGVTCLLYVVFHYFGRAPFLEPHLDRSLDPEDRQARAVYIQRVLGAVLLGGVPAGVAWIWGPYAFEDLGLGLARPLEALIFVGGLLVVVLPIIYFQTRKPSAWAHYPEIRTRRWDTTRYLKNFAAWTLYLLGYEFLFRGFLLFSLAHWLGPWPAIAIGTLAYAWAHLPKFSGETLGTIPMGVIFGAAALYTGGIWAPFLAHVIIANTSEYLTTHHNPATDCGCAIDGA